MPFVQRLPDGSEPAPAPLVLADPRRVGTVAAELVVNRLWARPHARMLLPTGRSPQAMYAVLRAHAAPGTSRSGTATVLQLDEYAGLGPGDPRSFAAQLRAQLEGIPLGAIRTIDGAAHDPAPRRRATRPSSRRRRSTSRCSGWGATGTSRSTSRPRGWPPA